MTGTTTTVLKDLLTEFRLWRSSPSRRDQILARSPDKEIPDPTPVEVPVGYKTPPSLAELVQSYVRQEVSQAAQSQGLGTFEEEDDFDVADPDDLHFSPYELTEYQMEEEYTVEDASPAEPPSAEAPAGAAEPPPAEPPPAQETQQ